MLNAAYRETRKRLTAIAKSKKSPIMGHYELTARCNLDCKMCYVHNQDNSIALKKELSTEQWKRIFDEACACGLIYASLSGGECMIRSDFKELYLYLWNKKIYVAVQTNGTMLTDDYIHFFTQYKPDMIQVSLYGSSEEKYQNVTGHKGLTKAIYGIQGLKNAGIDVRVAITPSKYMGDDYIDVIKLCNEKNFRLSLNDIVFLPNRDDPEKNDYQLTKDETVSLFAKRTQLSRELKPVENIPKAGGPCDIAQPKGLSCNGGNCLATVTYDGKMYPCVNALIGGFSLLEMSYAEAWKKTVAATTNFATSIECIGCPYDKVCPKCAAIRLKDFECGHCNSEICELYQNLVKAGVKKL